MVSAVPASLKTKCYSKKLYHLKFAHSQRMASHVNAASRIILQWDLQSGQSKSSSMCWGVTTYVAFSNGGSKLVRRVGAEIFSDTRIVVEAYGLLGCARL